MVEDREEELARLRAKVGALEARNKLLLAAIEASPAGIFVATAHEGEIRVWNSAALGIRSDEEVRRAEVPRLMDPRRWQSFHPDGTIYAQEELPLFRALKLGETICGEDIIIRRPSGHECWVTVHAAPVRDESGAIVAAVVVFPDITRRKEAEAELSRFRAIAEFSPDFVGMAAPDGSTLYVNPGGRALCGIEHDADLDGRPIGTYHPEESHALLFGTSVPHAIEHGHWQGETALLGPEGERIPVSQVLLAHRDTRGEVAYLSTVMRDLRPIRKLETQLRQSQRLESIGRLAGGIAHDFNNMLLIIDNYVRFVQETLPSEDARYEDLAMVLEASDRATELCRQLLGFARQQIIEPRVVDLNELVASFTKLIGRIIGEDITLEVVAEPRLWPVRIDPSQFDQVLANLAVNARDAMPQGGRLTIETGNVVFDEDYARLHPNVSPGEYVMLAVSDTGVGIPVEDQAHIFEPFFSTKGPGHGTGLGLATVHGAVKQNDGHILLYSKPGEGACFKIFLPRCDDESGLEPTHVDAATLTGDETVLVVEDERMVRRLSVRVLESAGYHVIEAQDPREALRLVAEQEAPIRLCVTDVVMPEMSGKQFADALAEISPETRVLYVSGYTQNTIVYRGVLEAGVSFLPKPFTARQLLTRARECLDDAPAKR
jgi:two-component system cell cycle sensor histidine kinase/response regulator CckA